MYASTPASAITYGTHVKLPVNQLRPHSARGMTIRFEWAGPVRGRSSAVTPEVLAMV